VLRRPHLVLPCRGFGESTRAACYRVV
jgi:hypothetical protein